MQFKQIISSVIIGVMLFSNMQIAYASDSITSDNINTISESTDDLGVQLNDLYYRVGEQLNIDYIYVKLIHLVAGGKAVYADQRPNIYNETTVDMFKGPFDIKGAEQEYKIQAPWAFCPDSNVERPSKYYLPDAAYSVTSDVVRIMNKRFYYDRGYMQNYFDALNKDVKTTILFYEAMLEYIGASQDEVNRFYNVYEKILYEKDKDENVLESDGEGVFYFKDEYRKILEANNISDESIEVLSIMLSFDSKLAGYNDPDTIKDEYVTPYKIGYTSRENLMHAAMSVVGKVRYVWGGGHLSTGNVEGINPAWKAFYDTYGTSEDEEGYRMSIKPTASWCPIHGRVENGDGCLLDAETVYSVEQYVDSRKEIMDTSNMTLDKYQAFIEKNIDIEKGVNSHRLDGLDCSGYTSWVFNQIISNRNYDSGANSFIRHANFNVVEYGSPMLPGDVFAWTGHIVIVVGKVDDSGKSHVILEASPNTVKFGVMYYTGVSTAELEKAINIAKEANELIGALPDYERTHIYNMDNRGYTSDGERYAEIGRLNRAYIDENTIITGYGKTIKEMYADEIIQNSINHLPYQYVSGYGNYDGKIFNTASVIGSLPVIKEDVITNLEEVVKEDTVEELVGIE